MTAATRAAARLLGLPSAGARGAAIAGLTLFAAGAALTSSIILPLVGWAGVAAVTALLTGVAGLCIAPGRGPWLRAGAAGSLLIVHALWGALAIAFAAVLSWTVAPWLWVVDGATAALALAGIARARPHLRVPVALPIGIAIAALFGGWMREDGLIRCDDYLRVRASGATVPVPATPELRHCRPGETLRVQRYPRQFWEDPSGNGFVVTTQRGDHDFSLTMPGDRAVPAWFDGAICRVRVGAAETPQCIGDGKSDGIAESARWDRLYVTTHDATRTTVYALPRSGGLRPLARTTVAMKGAVLYVDDESDIMGLCEDEGSRVYLLRPSDLSSLGSVPAPFLTDQIRYDERSHAGIACAAGHPPHGIDGQGFVAVAFAGAPFRYRPLAPSSQYPSSWLAATWGCDWDPIARRAYVAVASLGLLEKIDYDTGRILRRSFVGLGIRSVVFDPARRLAYAGFFLSGDVVAVDVDSGAIVARWNAGRFVRSLALSRDRASLLVTSNLGVVRIPLPPLPPTASASSAAPNAPSR